MTSLAQAKFIHIWPFPILPQFRAVPRRLILIDKVQVLSIWSWRRRAVIGALIRGLHQSLAEYCQRDPIWLSAVPFPPPSYGAGHECQQRVGRPEVGMCYLMLRLGERTPRNKEERHKQGSAIELDNWSGVRSDNNPEMNRKGHPMNFQKNFIKSQFLSVAPRYAP